MDKKFKEVKKKREFTEKHKNNIRCIRLGKTNKEILGEEKAEERNKKL